MAYITRNANIMLLFLILVSAAALVGATVFFQENFDRLNSAYSIKLSQLGDVSKDLADKQSALDQIKSELTLKSAREEEFTHQYTDVKTEKTQLEGEKKSLTQQNTDLGHQVQDTKSQLMSTQSTLEAAQNENALIKSQLAEAQANVIKLKKDKDDLAHVVNTRDTTISCLQTEKAKPDAEEGNC
jgi:chromosome segregation ATPase